ncbi:MAG: YdeI/OmpD-associated family protein, partial [Pseudarcicella sp.]|nr:YdeI/OmpD-associated family protein [Pseudarcicella sp.]
RYFISINSFIRAKIKKKVGDTVKLVLFQNTVLNENEEQQCDYQIWIDCLENEPKAFEKFHLLEKTEQEKIIDWIASAQNDTTKVDRISKSIDKLLLEKYK